MPAPFVYDRRFAFDVPRAELWSAVARTDRYREWLPWVHELDGDGLHEGAVARCVVRAPLPYTLRFDVRVVGVVDHEAVDAVVTGDLDGPAHLELDDGSGGSGARLRWALELRDPLLRPLATVARPAMVWAHDRVIEAGVREFERRLLDERPRR